MCTEKQADYVKKLANWKGRKINFEQIKEMTTEEVSSLIDDLKAMKSIKNGNNNKPAGQRDLNDIRFGMACKLVLQEKSILWAVSYEDKFIEEVKQLYELLDIAERSILGSFSLEEKK